MKKALSSILIVTLALAIIFSATMSTSAFELSMSESTASAYSASYPYPSVGQALITNTSWQTIASSTTGFNCNVYIKCNNTATSGLGVVPSDVRMLGKSGNVVWSENGAVPGLGSRVLWCGSDVYKIQIKTQAGLGTA